MTKHKGTDFKTPPLVQTLIQSSQMCVVGYDIISVTHTERDIWGLGPSIQNITPQGIFTLHRLKAHGGLIILRSGA